MTVLWDGLARPTSRGEDIQAEILELRDRKSTVRSNTPERRAVRGYYDALIAERRVWLTWGLWTQRHPTRYLQDVLGIGVRQEMALTPQPPRI